MKLGSLARGGALVALLLSASCNSAETNPQGSTPQVQASVVTTPSPMSSVAVTNAHSCQTAKDCHGMLPKMCKACTNGNTGGCAHWSCVENTCKIKTCDIPEAD